MDLRRSLVVVDAFSAPAILRRRFDVAGLDGTAFSRPTRGIIDIRPRGGRCTLRSVVGSFIVDECVFTLFADEGVVPIVIRRFGVLLLGMREAIAAIKRQSGTTKPEKRKKMAMVYGQIPSNANGASRRPATLISTVMKLSVLKLTVPLSRFTARRLC